MQRDTAASRIPRDPVPVVHYGDPRDLEAQVFFALSSLRVVAGFLAASKFGTCEHSEDDEAAGEVVSRALEFLEGLDLLNVKQKAEEERSKD